MDREHRNALRFANKIRHKLGKPPVDHLYKGAKAKTLKCPITNTIYNDDDDLREQFGIQTELYNVAVFDFLKKGSVVKFNTTETVRQFILRFDGGRYPELEL